MYFKNRIDNQVKIKGHRIELDEITFNVKKFGIKSVHTVIYDNKIITFYTDKKKFLKKKIDKFLKETIPEYMIPNHIYQIKKFPLTPNGKLNINKLIQFAKKYINEKN
jgi:acyl-coenzyme A synthetase/AMP-(fatty) acid ligase